MPRDGPSKTSCGGKEQKQIILEKGRNYRFQAGECLKTLPIYWAAVQVHGVLQCETKKVKRLTFLKRKH